MQAYSQENKGFISIAKYTAREKVPTRESNIKEGVEDQLKIEEQSGPNLCNGVPIMCNKISFLYICVLGGGLPTM